MNFNPAAFMPPFRGLPFLPAAPVPTHQPFWELPMAPRVTAPISQANPFVLSAYPGQTYMSGLFGFGQRGPERRPVQPPHIHNIAHTQGPLNWRAQGAFQGATENPAPFLPATALRTTVPASASGGIGNYGGPWNLGLRPPPPRPFAQVAPIMFPMNAQQWPCRVYGEGARPTFQAAVPPDDSNTPQSIYEDFRHWQRFKTLVRRHYPQTPDVEALSCFLVPVLRSLSRLEPTITMEEGLWKGLQEWQRTSNFDRMIYYETAEKFVEFEAAEEMEDPRMQLSGVFQCRPPPVPRRLDHPRPPVPKVVQQSGCTSRKTSLTAQPAHCLPAKPNVLQTKVSETKVSETKAHETKARRIKVPETKARETKARHIKAPKIKAPETKAPEEIPPEAIQEYMDIMDELLGPIDFAMLEPSSLFIGEPDANMEEEELDQQPIDDDLYPDPSLLSYVDQDFVNKAETMISSRFLEEILSSKPYINILALTKELEQEEGLASEQDSRASEAAPTQGAEKRKHHMDQGVSMENPDVASQDVKKCRTTDPELLGPKDTASLPSSRGSSSLGDTRSNLPPQNQTSSSLNLGNKGVVGPRRATTSGGPHGTANRCSVDDDLQSLDFLLGSQQHLLPWGLSQSQGPHMEPLRSGDQPLQAPLTQRGGLSHQPPLAAMSKKRALTGHSGNVAKMPRLELPLQVTGGQDLDLVRTSQPQKRKCKSSGNQKKKKRP